jgi:hypothetical protein
MDTNGSPTSPADVEPPPAPPDTAAARRPPTADPSLRRWASEYANWLDDRDHSRPLSRRDLWSTNDELAAEVTAAGGGIAAGIEATRLKTEENVRRLIDAEIVVEADKNDRTWPQRRGESSRTQEDLPKEVFKREDHSPAVSHQPRACC